MSSSVIVSARYAKRKLCRSVFKSIKVVSSDFKVSAWLFVFAENEPIGSNDTRQPIPVERRETPRKQETPPSKQKFSEPSANTEVVQGGKRPLGRLVSGQKPAATTSYPFNRSEGRDSVGSSTEDSSVVSARALKKNEPRTSGW